MSNLFDRLGRYLPLFTVIMLWLAVLPIRLVALLALPPVTTFHHPLRNVREFFLFEMD